MKTVELRWKKRKDGSITTVHADDVYRIYSSREKTLKLHDVWFLTRDGRQVYSSIWDTGKAECKRVACRLAAGAKPIWEKVAEDLNDLDKAKFKQMIGYMDALNLPAMPGPGKDLYRKQCEKGNYPTRWLGVTELELDEAELTNEYILSLQVELWPVYTMANRKQERLMKRKKRKEDAQAPTPAEPIVKATPKPLEVYTGPPPKNIDTSKLSRFYVVTDPYPYRLKNAKFSSVLRWIDKVREFFRKKGKFISVQCLLYMVRKNELTSEERKIKAGRRVISILRDEYEADRAKTASMIQISLSTPKEEEGKVPKKKGKRPKDKFGNKVGTRASKINAVLSDKPHSAVWIRKKAGNAGSVHSHLNALVKEGLVVKIVREGKAVRYRLSGPEDKIVRATKPKKIKGKKKKRKGI